MFEANILGGVWGWISDHTTATAMAVIIPFAIGYAVKEGKKLLTKFIKTKENKEMALWIAHLADELTDQLIAKYPKNEWAKRLNDAVDALQDTVSQIQPISQKVAQRAVEAAAGRKNGEPV